MLGRLARFTVERRRLTLVAAVIVFLVSGALGGDVAAHLSTGGFEDPTSESFQADQALLDRFGVGVPNVVLLVTADDPGTGDQPAVNRPDVADAGSALTARLAAEPGVTDVASYWSLGQLPPLRNDDGTRALVLARLTGSEDEVDARIDELVAEYEGDHGVVDVQFSGFAHIFSQVSDTIEHDLVRAELIAIPITLILLLFIFRSVVAAALPLAIGALSVVSTFLVLRILASFTDVSVFALNLVTAMGLGLAIDYALFVVNRYREELAGGHDHDQAVARTVRTAGRTVAFSAGTVAASLLALLVFPIGFLKSFAYAGVAVAALAGLFSVTVLPALMAALGPRIDALAIRNTRSSKPVEAGAWYRVARGVMRRPIPIATVVVIVLLFLGTPFRHIELGLPDDRVLPPDADARVATDVIRDEFSSNEAGAASVVATDIGDPTSPQLAAAIDDYARRLSLLPDVARVDSSAGVYADGAEVIDSIPFLVDRFARPHATYLSVVPDVEPNSLEGEAFVNGVRAEPAPFDVQVTGTSAQLADSKSALLDAMPLALAIIAAITFVLLFLLFGSVVVPLKALVLNVLSLSATFGAIVYVFQEGHFSGPLGFTAVGSTDATAPILMFCTAFGLSMDYEVFLLSRIKEEYDRTGDNRQAVAVGLEKTGRIVTAAAVLISVVFLSFGTSDVRFIKLFGLGLALAVVVDAFVIRGTLVPAFMRLADKANWWAPAPLRRLHDRIGISEHAILDDESGHRTVADPVLVEPGDGDSARGDGAERPAAPRRRRDRPLVAAGRQPPPSRSSDPAN